MKKLKIRAINTKIAPTSNNQYPLFLSVYITINPYTDTQTELITKLI